MNEFIDRPESRYLDILHIGIQAILSLKSPNGRYDKYEDGKLIEKSLLRLELNSMILEEINLIYSLNFLNTDSFKKENHREL